MDRFCQLLPKVELHAHINGSCSKETAEKLVNMKKAKDSTWQPSAELKFGKEKQTLQECFEQFKLLHELCDSDEAAYLVTSDVIGEFAEDGVQYLELRTTPRDVAARHMSKSSYVGSVLSAINASVASANHRIVVRLLLAIDRRMSVHDIEETLKLAEMYAAETNPVIVGLDLSGDPYSGSAETYVPFLECAKRKGLKLSLHLAEIAGVLHETETLLSVNPDRIGHGTFLIPELAGSSELADKVLAMKTPIELCLSSNVQTKTVSDYQSHHFDFWYRKQHPCTICTDDKGVFATTLSKEYTIAAENFNLTRENLWNLSYDTINWIFAGDDVKTELRTKWNDQKDLCFKEAQ